tara:strand:- start:1017 stop:1889 length:873 start_codon:yes stop_codon:yes gene_type:complete
MKIIITGPNGFIAKNIINSFKFNKDITLLTNNKIRYPFFNKFKVLNFDLGKNIPKLSCDILIHPAAITPQKNYSWNEYNKINYLSLKKIIKNIKINKRLIFFSTTDIYKNQKIKKFFLAKENTKIDEKKLGNYAKSKYRCELFLKSLDQKKYSFKTIILRLPGIVGRQSHKTFISNLANSITSKKSVSFFGGNNLFNNIYHIDKLVKIIKYFIKFKFNKRYEIINISTNNPVTIKKVIQISGVKVKKSNANDNKKDMFVIDVNKLNKYYKIKYDTSRVLKKYFRENYIGK